ncbi:MAG: response regulator transcription factor [Cytophagales bacterium]|nr:response regulator transcription factor [Cytophagales bacterium]
MSIAARPIKLGIVDDHQLYRKGLMSLLEKWGALYEIVLEAMDGETLANLINPSVLPDVIIMDINMPRKDGFESISWLNEHYPKINVLVLSMVGQEESIVRMIKYGVKGYLTKDIDPDVLHEALQTVVQGKFYYTDFLSRKLIHAIQEDDRVTLTERELRFIKLACTEMTYQQIADEMFVSPKTVDGYRKALFEKLKVKSRVGLAMYAVNNGWV